MADQAGENVQGPPCQSAVSNAGVVRTAVRIPEGLHARLLAEADARDVSVNWLVTRAVERFLGGLSSPHVSGTESIPGTGGICENCGKPMREHGPKAECYPAHIGRTSQVES